MRNSFARARLALARSAAAAAMFAGLVLAGCGDDTGSGDQATGDAGDSATGADMGHVHGLGVADGTLYVASHHGLFAVSSDGAVRIVSEDDHDFMGFTVVDDGMFLGSGHPGSRTDLPGNLGLLESTDGGVTWESVSLMGDVDFHALAATDDAVYGLDSASGQLLVSTDHITWEERGEIPLADLAVHPDDGSTIVVTVEAGPHISTDSGQSFEPLDDAPLLMLVDWADELYGMTPDGAVHRSSDGGVSWEARGEVGGRPHAMTVGPDGAVYAGTEEAIVVSADDGETFSVLFDMS